MAGKNGPLLSQLIDPSMIYEAIRKNFDVQLQLIDRLVYRKIYLKCVDKMMLLPKGYKVLDFTTFLEDNEKSTMEHVGWFSAQCADIS